MELGSKNLSIAIGFIGKTTNALSLTCMMEFDDIIKTFVSKTVNMIEAKPINIEVESDSEIESVNVIQEDILLNIKIVENLYKNS